jgi:hypothetical protein
MYFEFEKLDVYQATLNFVAVAMQTSMIKSTFTKTVETRQR